MKVVDKVTHTEEELKALAPKQQEFFNDMITMRDNFRISVTQMASWSQSQMNDVIRLHNEADQDEVHGERLYHKLMELEQEGLLESMDVDRLFVMSIDWPVGLKVEPVKWEKIN